ncbi:MAG: hypothetical protein IJZ77_02690 [Bacilli bacterium]|nr:hypothetical protein [Bacilli bacterium]
MRLLLNERNLIVAIGNDIEYGIWGNVGTAASWKIASNSYMMDGNFHLVDIGNMEIPTYVHERQYYFIDNEFKLADECPNEYRDNINTNTKSIITIEDAMCETEVYNDERIAALEDAICELSTLLI